MKYEAAQKIFNGKYKVPREFHEANFANFQASYPGSYSTGTTEITVQPIEAFQILYMRKNSKVYGDQLGVKTGSSKGNRKKDSNGTDKRGQLRDSGKPAIRPDKQREVEKQPETGSISEYARSEAESGGGDSV